MAKSQVQIEHDIVAELGKRQAAGLKTHACTRLCGLLTRGGKEWDTAFEHISDHFRPQPDKPSHTMFAPKYRNKESLRDLLLQAASAPSHVRLTKLMIHGDNIGEPAVEIVRVFGTSIGDEPSLKMLRIFVDYRGDLITAYPGAEDE